LRATAFFRKLLDRASIREYGARHVGEGFFGTARAGDGDLGFPAVGFEGDVWTLEID
jgi:hypothetical protein